MVDVTRFRESRSWLAHSALLAGFSGAMLASSAQASGAIEAISRMAALGSPVSIDVDLGPDDLTAPFDQSVVRLSDGEDIFDREATMSVRNGHRFITLSTVASAAAGRHEGSLLLDLCKDRMCKSGPVTPMIALPYDINIIANGQVWPGDHLTSLSSTSNTPDWAMFQGNAAHTGFVPVRVDPNKITTRWQIFSNSLQASFIPGVASMATSDGLVYLSGDLQLKVFRESDGGAVWSHDFSDLTYPSVNPPAVVNGVAYVAAGHQSSTYMFAFDAKTGVKQFQTQMSSQWETYLSPAVGDVGVYTNAGTYGGLYGFSFTGTQLFFSSEQQQSVWTPAVDGSGVYSYTGELRIVNPSTGALTHSIKDPSFTNYVGTIGGSPVLGSTGSVFAANYANAQFIGDNTLLNFRVDTDSIGWRVDGAYPTTPGYSDGNVYAVNNRPLRLEVRAERNGALRSSWTPPSSGGDAYFVSEVLLTQNLIFVSTNITTYAISRTTNKVVWSYPISGKLALSKSGILYVQSPTSLTAFNVSQGR
jgi:hypothetical protein